VIWFAVGLYLVLFFALLHLVDSLASARPQGASSRPQGTSTRPQGEDA